jgi:hypothetical protein
MTDAPQLPYRGGTRSGDRQVEHIDIFKHHRLPPLPTIVNIHLTPAANFRIQSEFAGIETATHQVRGHAPQFDRFHRGAASICLNDVLWSDRLAHAHSAHG